MGNAENKDWLITNKIRTDCRLPLAYQSNVSLFTSPLNLKRIRISGKDIQVMIDGFILPRLDCFGRYQEYKAEELIAALFDKFGFSFIHHVKGSFVLLLIIENKIYLYTDRIGLKRCFYMNKGYFQISNILKLLTETIDLELDMDSIVLLSLMHHFIDSRTVFKDIKYTLPASFVEIGDIVSSKTYWNLDSLLNLERKNISYNNFAEILIQIAESYINYFKPKRISMTLTGGMDSRTILATLFKLGIKPYTFTFGSPLSADVSIGKKIAEDFNFEQNNHYEQDPTSEWYARLTEEIIEKGNSLVHIHRAHRLDAIKKELALHSDIDMLLVGSMGGEGIRGLHYDDLIVTDFVRRIYAKNAEFDRLIKEKSTDYFLRSDKINQEKVSSILKQQRYFQRESKKNEFFILFDLVAGLHDIQDISLYSCYIKYVVPLFMDIDYLNVLFSSKYSMLNKEKTSKNPLKKLRVPEVHCNLIRILWPQLCNVPFSNGFSPQEYLRGPLFYFFARSLSRLFGKKYPSNFLYTDFFIQFTQRHLDALDDPNINRFYNIEKAKADLQNGRHSIKENYWHKFSNIIMISKFLSHFQLKKLANQ